MEGVIELASFVMASMDMENTLSSCIISGIKEALSAVRNICQSKDLVQLNKVYGLDGPGRASGNSLNTLIDAHILTRKGKYLPQAEAMIRCCVHPEDDIGKGDVLDVENIWMYTIFSQGLGKSLDVKAEKNESDPLLHYARQTLIRYARWMLKNEYLYLDKPENLEYPNETRAAQEIRKCNVLLYAVKYSESDA